MTAEPLDRRRSLTEARDRLVNPLTGLRLRLEELLSEQAGDASVALELRDALGIVDRLDGELDEVLGELVARLPQGPAISLVDVTGTVLRGHDAAAGPHGRRLSIGAVDDVAVAADRTSLTMLVERMVLAACGGHDAPVEVRATRQGGTVTLQVGLAEPCTRSGAVPTGATCSREVISALAERCGGRWVPAAPDTGGVRVVLPVTV